MNMKFYRLILSVGGVKKEDLKLLKETQKQYKLVSIDDTKKYTVNKDKLNMLLESKAQDTDSFFARTAYATDEECIKVLTEEYKDLAMKHFEDIKTRVETSLEKLSNI